jgi:hypothetical protein
MREEVSMRQRSILMSAVGLLVLGAITPHTVAQVHEDKEYGFRIIPPKKWTRLPGKIGETWVIGKYISDREFFYNDEQGWSYGHKPEMTIIAFVRPKKSTVTGPDDEIPDVEAPPEPEAPKPPGSPDKIKLSIEYRDYKAYLKSNHTGGGYYFSEEEEDAVNDIPTTCYEIKVEKLTWGGPRRIVTWVYHTDEIDFAVQFEMLENSYDKMRSTFLRTLKSFKVIEREGDGPDKQETSLTFYDTEDWTPEEREELRKLLEERSHEGAIKNLPNDWEHKKYGNVLVLSHVGMKYAKKMVDQSNAVMAWLDDNFYFVGPDEYVRGPIIRICKDWEEENSFRSAGDFWGGLGTEVVTHKDLYGGNQSYEFRYVNGRVMDIWFQDRDKDLYWALPNWLRGGMRAVIEGGVANGRKLEFQATTWELRDLREADRNENLTSPKDLMRMGQEDLYAERHRSDESAALVRYLMEGKGPKKSRDVIVQYIANIKAITEELDAEAEKDEGEKAEKPKTEAEEDEYFKQRANDWKKKERYILDEVFFRTFKDWDDGDWKSLESSYFRSIT